MKGSLALLLFAAFVRFVDPGELNAPKERRGPGGGYKRGIPFAAWWTYTDESTLLFSAQNRTVNSKNPKEPFLFPG
jgi:hypothetical protein